MNRNEFEISLRTVSFYLMHGLLVTLYFGGVSWTAVAIFGVTYYLKMFGLSAGIHRYFAHRAFKTSRAFQFVLSLMGAASGHRGPLWASSHHRWHHAKSDTVDDYQSPIAHGLIPSHFGWHLHSSNQPTRLELMGDFKKYPELLWVNRFHLPIFLVSAVLTTLLGHYLSLAFPQLQTSALQFFAWGVVASTLLCAHVIMMIGSVAHADNGKKNFGYQSYDVGDYSVNLPWHKLALGEENHNNHHKYPNAACTALRGPEIDPIYWGLYLLAKFGIVWDLKLVNEHESTYTLKFCHPADSEKKSA